MGFKWFKARVTMNRMPAHTSAVAGSYRTKTFDEPNTDYISHYNSGERANIKPEQKLGIRHRSMPVLNDQLNGVSNEDDDLGFVHSSNIEAAHSSSTRTLDGSEISGEDMYNGLGVGKPVVLPKHIPIPISNEDLIGGIIAQKTPRPVQKKGKGDYKKKKLKAPAPKMLLNTSSGSTSENGSVEFLTLKDRRKTSQDSDIDV